VLVIVGILGPSTESCALTLVEGPESLEIPRLDSAGMRPRLTPGKLDAPPGKVGKLVNCRPVLVP